MAVAGAGEQLLKVCRIFRARLHRRVSLVRSCSAARPAGSGVTKPLCSGSPQAVVVAPARNRPSGQPLIGVAKRGAHTLTPCICIDSTEFLQHPKSRHLQCESKDCGDVLSNHKADGCRRVILSTELSISDVSRRPIP